MNILILAKDGGTPWAMDLSIVFPYIISFLTTLISGMALYITKKLYDKNTELREQRKTANLKREHASDVLMLATARKNIKEEMMEHLNKGYVTTAEYEEVEEAYNAYVDCGGNGTLHHLHDDRWVNLKIKDEISERGN